MKYSTLSDYQIKKIIRCFADELTAMQTAKMLNLNRNTIDRYYTMFREKIAELRRGFPLSQPSFLEIMKMQGSIFFITHPTF